jgi:hypothetical protein
LGLDLSTDDLRRIEDVSEQKIFTGGTFSGYAYRGEYVVLSEESVLTLKIAPRQRAPREDAIIAAWYDQMLGRIRGALMVVRQEAAELHRINPRRYPLP